MSGFGAILKAITRAIEGSIDRVLHFARGDHRPKLIPITIPAKARRPRR